MTKEEQRICDLEQALLAALSAVEQFGVSPEDVRFSAIGGLLHGGSWKWVSDNHVGGAIHEIDVALGRIRTASNTPLIIPPPSYRRRPSRVY